MLILKFIIYTTPLSLFSSMELFNYNSECFTNSAYLLLNYNNIYINLFDFLNTNISVNFLINFEFDYQYSIDYGMRFRLSENIDTGNPSIFYYDNSNLPNPNSGGDSNGYPNTINNSQDNSYRETPTRNDNSNIPSSTITDPQDVLYGFFDNNIFSRPIRQAYSPLDSYRSLLDSNQLLINNNNNSRFNSFYNGYRVAIPVNLTFNQIVDFGTHICTKLDPNAVPVIPAFDIKLDRSFESADDVDPNFRNDMIYPYNHEHHMRMAKESLNNKTTSIII